MIDTALMVRQLSAMQRAYNVSYGSLRGAPEEVKHASRGTIKAQANHHYARARSIKCVLMWPPLS